MIRCVAFDFDGTLVDSNQIKHDMFFRVAAAIEGGDEILATVLREKPGDRHAIFRRFVQMMPGLRRDDTPEQQARRAEEMADQYATLCEEAISACAEIPGAGKLLTELQRNSVITALNSATPTRALADIVTRRGWADAFAYVLGGPSGKAENLMQLATATGLRREEIVMVGDQAVDQQGAAEFGCHFVALLRPDNAFSGSPVHVISELEQLPAMLGRL